MQYNKMRPFRWDNDQTFTEHQGSEHQQNADKNEDNMQCLEIYPCNQGVDRYTRFFLQAIQFFIWAWSC